MLSDQLIQELQLLNSIAPFSKELMTKIAAYAEADDKVESALKICSLFLDQKIDHPADALIAFTRSDLIKSLKILKDAQLLSGDLAATNFSNVLNHKHLWALPIALDVLIKNKLLAGLQAQTNLTLVLNHQEPLHAAYALAKLNNDLAKNTMVRANYAAIFAHTAHMSPQDTISALEILNKENLLTGPQAQIIFDAVIKHPAPTSLASAFIALNKANLLSEANLQTLLRADNLPDLAPALERLTTIKPLDCKEAQANFETVQKHKNPRQLTSAFIILMDAKLSTEANRETLLRAENLPDLVAALKALYAANLLTGPQAQSHFELAGKNPIAIHQALKSLSAPAAQDFLQAGQSLLSLGIKLDEAVTKRLHELAKIQAKALAKTPAREITWDFIQLLGLAYAPSAKHPLHGKLAEAMRTGQLKALLAQQGINEPTDALKIVFRLLHSHKPNLFFWIETTFKQAGKIEALSPIRTDRCEASLRRGAEHLQTLFTPSAPVMATTFSRYAASSQNTRHSDDDEDHSL